MTVLIKGRDLPPIARFLEALTTSGFLTQPVTWTEGGDWIKLHVPEDDKTRQAFERKGFPVFSDK